MTEPTAPPAEVPKDARTWGALCHLAAFSWVFTGIGLVIGPLVVWILKRNESPFVDDRGKESLNFQITTMIAFIACIPLCFIFIGFPLAFIVTIVNIVLTIKGAIRASEGVAYRYPFSLRLVQ